MLGAPAAVGKQVISDRRLISDSVPGSSVKTCTTNPVGMAQCTETALPRISAHTLINYMRVSTDSDRQVLGLQRDALTEAGCAKIFTEQMSGAVTDRPALHDALELARSGDTLIVWKLHCLARSMKQLIETVETLWIRGIGLRSLTEALDTTTVQGRFFTCLAHWRSVSGA